MLEYMRAGAIYPMKDTNFMADPAKSHLEEMTKLRESLIKANNRVSILEDRCKALKEVINMFVQKSYSKK